LDLLIRKAPFLIAIMFLSLSVMAQENCDPTQSKKAQKILDKVYSAAKYTPEEIESMLLEALEEDEECLSCRFALARIQYQIATERNKSYGSALDNFDKVIKQCATFHADAVSYTHLTLPTTPYV